LSNASLASAGVIKVVQLRKLGSVLAYARVKRARGKANVTLIWTLGGMLTDILWRVIARKHRTIPLLARVEQQRVA
jgi:DNA transformation protein